MCAQSICLGNQSDLFRFRSGERCSLSAFVRLAGRDFTEQSFLFRL